MNHVLRCRASSNKRSSRFWLKIGARSINRKAVAQQTLFIIAQVYRQAISVRQLSKLYSIIPNESRDCDSNSLSSTFRINQFRWKQFAVEHHAARPALFINLSGFAKINISAREKDFPRRLAQLRISLASISSDLVTLRFNLLPPSGKLF